MIAVIYNEGSGFHGRPLSIASDFELVFLLQQCPDFALAEWTAGRHVLLIMDEAINVEADMREELRILVHVNPGKEGILQIIVFGQSELQDRLRPPELRQLAQLVMTTYPLETVTPAAHIDRRLEHFGGAVQEFIANALRYVHVEAGGIPSLINELRDLALVCVANAKEKGWLWSQSRRSSKKGWSSNLLNPILVFSNRAASRVKAAE